MNDTLKADQALLASMRALVFEKGMLTGLSAAFGNRNEDARFCLGFRREVVSGPGGFLPAPLEITPDTVFDLASLTKLFTLVSVLLLVQNGKLRWDDCVGRLDRRFAGLADCAVRDCVCYMASLQTPERVDAQPDVEAAEAMVFRTVRMPLRGERLYSDMNALVLKYVVEAVSGYGLMDFLSRFVLGPLGMGETWAAVPPGRIGDLMDYNHEHRVSGADFQILEGALPGLPHDPKARLLGRGGLDLCGHAGLFSTAGDLCRLARGLLSGALLSMDTLRQVGINRTGYLTAAGEYRQFLGQLCFAKSPVARLSEVPSWMGLRAFALAGYTGNHLAIDPDLGVFDLFLGNRCHNRLARVEPPGRAAELGLMQDGSGTVPWPDGRRVKSSYQYIHQKDKMLHAPVLDCLTARGWLEGVPF